MKNIGIISYNIYGNFTNYGSALQSWALHQKVVDLGYHPILVDYCPDVLKEKDILDPFKNMWDKDEESKKMCELTMPAIKENYYKFNDFYTNKFYRTNKKYTSSNFNEVFNDEKIDGFVCGSDTIFCINEFGFDDGFYANYNCMKNKSISYAASFGDSDFNEEKYKILNNRLQNFLALGIRENQMIPYIQENTEIEVRRVIDPTLLFDSDKYDTIAVKENLVKEKYILYYSRRYSPIMEEYVENLAKKNNWKIVEISLRAINAEKGHIMYYQAGVEEFLSLIKNAEYVVTNSYHGMIFAVQYKKPFVIFSRELCNTKIEELLDLLGLKDHMLINGTENFNENINYDKVFKNIYSARNDSLEFLSKELHLL